MYRVLTLTTSGPSTKPFFGFPPAPLISAAHLRSSFQQERKHPAREEVSHKLRQQITQRSSPAPITHLPSQFHSVSEPVTLRLKHKPGSFIAQCRAKTPTPGSVDTAFALLFFHPLRSSWIRDSPALLHICATAKSMKSDFGPSNNWININSALCPWMRKRRKKKPQSTDYTAVESTRGGASLLRSHLELEALCSSGASIPGG